MWSIDRFLYSLVDPYYYDSLNRRKPDADPYIALARPLLPRDWQSQWSTLWFHCGPSDYQSPAQGWKIHISATTLNASEVLRTVVPLVVEELVPFKFAADEHVLSLLLSKSWIRGGAGKFITIYPRDLVQFYNLIERLHLATASYAGPYILSDRRYEGSKCVFYRYGSFFDRSALRVNGERSSYILSPTGEQVPDVRRPWFVLPDWVQDPFPNREKLSSAAGGLKSGRYQVTASLRFSNSGGVYLARDTESGEQVVIKEARPLSNFQPSGSDAVALLRKEYRLLQRIEGSRIAPRPMDFFEEWEHSFLVEEYLGGAVTLREHANRHAIALITKPTPEKVVDFLRTFRRVFQNVARIITLLHREYGMVFRDLSPKNVMILESGEVKLLDFEAACEIGVDPMTTLFTPGFASNEYFASEFARFENDYYALGALMMCYCMPIHSLVGLDASALVRFAQSISEDYGLPANLQTLICDLLNPIAETRPNATEVIATLNGNEVLRNIGILERPDFKPREYQQLLEGVTESILRAANYDREDRLFPSDPTVFVTNPLSVAYGACGVAYALHRINRELPRCVSEWILTHLNADTYPPGLYIGLAGVAWVLREIGYPERAEQILLSTRHHPLLFESPDVFFGLAGWGMANLKFHYAFDRQVYLDRAVEAGEWLIQNRVEIPEGYHWQSISPNGYSWIGFAHGSSGIAVFLLYLYLATNDGRYLAAAERALSFDLANAMGTSRGGRSWPMDKGPAPTVVPYWRWGSAGVGAAVLRFLQVSPKADLQNSLEDAIKDTARKYTISPGKFFGLSACGDFLLDAADFGIETERRIQDAHRVASGLQLFCVNPVARGPAFPGLNLMKISCDYGTGGAGVALFLHRLLNHSGCDFMVDELLDRRRQSNPACKPDYSVAV